MLMNKFIVKVDTNVLESLTYIKMDASSLDLLLL